MKIVISLFVAALLGGCVAAQPYGYYGEQYPVVPQAPVQYAPPPVQYVPPRVMYMPPPVVMYAPMYGGYGGYYGGDPLFRFNFNFGKGGRHHGGGRHHRRW